MATPVVAPTTRAVSTLRLAAVVMGCLAGVTALVMAVVPVRAADFAGTLDPSLKLGNPAAARVVHYGCGSLVAPRKFSTGVGVVPGLLESQHEFQQDGCNTARHGRGLAVDYFVAAAVAALLAAGFGNRRRRLATFALGVTAVLVVFAIYFTAIMGRSTGPLT